jgi:hypothetical protein
LSKISKSGQGQHSVHSVAGTTGNNISVDHRIKGTSAWTDVSLSVFVGYSMVRTRNFDGFKIFQVCLQFLITIDETKAFREN